MPATILTAVCLLAFQPGDAGAAPTAADAGAAPTAATAADAGAPPAEPQTAAGAGSGQLVPVRRPAAPGSAAALVRQAFAQPLEQPLDGQPVALLDVVRGLTDPVQQDRVVAAYWNLAIAVANYHFALDGRRRLRDLAGPADTGGDLVQRELDVARADAEVLVQRTRLAAAEAQHGLMALRPGILATILPLPADLPHAGAYRTYYEQIFTPDRLPKARQLNEVLARYQDLIQAQAAAVNATRALADQATTDRDAPLHGTSQWLDSQQKLAERRREFLAGVHQYNLRIARYARLVSPGPVDPARFVAMLVKSEPRLLSPQATRPAAPLEADGLTSVLKDRPGSVAAGGSAAVTQATAEEPAGEWQKSEPAKPQRQDQFVPRRPGLE